MDAIHPTQAQVTNRRPTAPVPLQPEVASTDVHLISHFDATEPVIEPFATATIQQLEEMKKSGGAHVTADVLIDRQTEAPAWKIFKGAVTTAILLAPLAGGIALACGVGGVLAPLAEMGTIANWAGKAGAVYLGFKGTKQLALHGYLQKGLGRIMSGINASKMAEPRWDGRRTYSIAADSSAAIDSTIKTQGDLPKVRSADDITNFLVSNTRAYPSGTTVVHMMGHGLGYRYSVGLPFAAYEKVLADTATQTGKPADILLLESCLQGNMEALAATYPFARYAVMSEETISAGVIGEILKETVKRNAGRSLTPKDLGRFMIENAGTTASPLKASAETLTMFDMQKVPALNAAVDKLGGLLANEVKDGRESGLIGAVKSTPSYPKHPLFRLMREKLGLGDLKQFCERLEQVYNGGSIEVPGKAWGGLRNVKNDERYPDAIASPHAADITKAAKDVLDALDKAIVAHHTSAQYQGAGGVTIQMPGPYKSMESKKGYKQSGLGTFDASAAPTGWKAFVESLNTRMV